MKLLSLRADRLPGVDRPLHLDGLAPGVNVIVGPNASGKSSLVRALLALLYPVEHEGVFDVRAEWTTVGGVLRAQRLGQDVAWDHAGRAGPAPALPPYHLVGAYSIRLEDLLAVERAAPPHTRGRKAGQAATTGDNGVDGAIADVIGRALSGGVDLRAVRSGIGKQAEAGKRLADRLHDAVAERRRLTTARRALREREETLPAQAAELSDARERASRAQAVADAHALLEARREVEARRADLEDLPARLERLRGDEHDRLLEIDRQLASETGRADDVAREAAELRGSLARAGIDPELTRAAVDLQVGRAAQLVTHAKDLDTRRVELAALKARKREVERRLGGAPHSQVLVDDELLETVEVLLEARQAAASDSDALERQRSRLAAEVPLDPGTDETADRLTRLRADLLRWLGTPSDSLHRPAWAWAVALALTVATAATAGLVPGPTAPFTLAGALALWLLLTGVVFRSPADVLRRSVEADAGRSLGLLDVEAFGDLAEPLTWDHTAVADRVAAIDRALALRARLLAEHERRLAALRGVEADLGAARARRDEAQRGLDHLRARHGVSVGPDVGLAAWLHASRAMADVTADLAGVNAAGSQLHDRVTREAHGLKRFLVEAGVGTADEVEALEPDRLAAAISDLAGRVLQRDADRARLAGLEREHDRAREGITRLEAERAKLLEGAGVTTGAGVTEAVDSAEELRRRVALLPRWLEASDALRRADAAVRHLERLLERDPELLELAANGDAERLELLARDCEAAHARVEELERSIRQTHDDIDRAASDRSIERATARLADAEEALTAHRDEALRLRAAGFLLDQVEAEQSEEARPPELIRAAALFQRFTRGAYTLRAERDGSRWTLVAVDAHDRLVPLEQLSSGTRAQLLIAARLAFALEAETRVRDTSGPEHGTRPMVLPFVLDEALTTTDPERFTAVATALLDVAQAEGRQVIYLSARQDDAEMWLRAADRHGTSVAVVHLGSHGVGSAASPAAS